MKNVRIPRTTSACARTAIMLTGAMMLSGLGCLTPAVRPGTQRSDVDLQALIDAAANGTSVTIPYGTWTIDAPLTLDARRGLTITARPGTRILASEIMEPVIAVSSSDSIRIENLYLRHIKPSTFYQCEGACIALNTCNYAEVANCELSGCGAAGVYASASHNVTVRNCNIYDCTFADIWTQYSSNILAQDNRMHGRVYQWECTNVREQGNRSR